MTGILAVCLVLVFVLNSKAVTNSLGTFSPPSGFEPVADVDLSRQAYSTEMLAEFALQEPAYRGVFVSVHNIDTSYFDLRVVGPNGYSSVVLHGEGYRADRDGGLWEEKLLPGTYQVILTAHQSPGAVAVFLRTH